MYIYIYIYICIYYVYCCSYVTQSKVQLLTFHYSRMGDIHIS